MKFYKRKPIDRHNPTDNSWVVQANGNIETTSKGSMELPAGGASDRPTSTVNGQLRYSTTLNEAEAHINGVWERVRTVRPSTIVVQNLGNGNYLNNIFGPLNPDYEPSYAKSNANVMIYVDNVYQIPSVNYSLSLTAPVDFQLTITDNVGIGSTTIPVATLTNILVGMTVSGPGGIQANSRVLELTTQSSIVISLPAADNIPASTPLNFTYNTGTYINFAGAVPMKPIVALLGFDGYFPPI